MLKRTYAQTPARKINFLISKVMPAVVACLLVLGFPVRGHAADAVAPKPLPAKQDTVALQAQDVNQQTAGGVSSAIPAADSAKVSFSQNAAKYKKTGDAYAKKGLTDKAMASYRQYVDSSAPGPAVYKTARQLGEYYFRKNLYYEAARYLLMVKGKERDVVSLKAMLGISLFRTGNNKQAIEILTPITASTALKLQTKLDVLRVLGESCFKTDKIDKAASWYEKYLKLGGKKVPDLSYAAALRLESVSPAKAKQRYTANMTGFPADYRNPLRLGLLLASDPAAKSKSETLIKKAALLAAKKPGAWIDFARVYGQLGRADVEMAAYKKYLRVDSVNLEAQTRIGAILLDKGKTDEAIRILEGAHRQAPDSLGITISLASAYLNAGNSTEAAALLVIAKEQAPQDPEVHRKMFEAYRSLGQDPQALDEINAYLELKRDNTALLDCANLLLKMGRFDEAANRLEDIRATDPENIEAIMALAMVKRGQQKFDTAIELYKEANSLNSGYAPALFERAETHLLQGKPQWAEEFYGRALERDPKMALAVLGLAKVALVHSDRATYLKHLAKASAMDPRNPLIAKELENSRNAPASGSATGSGTSGAPAPGGVK
jgi:tetratricopeptide (TPR) repeat protein